MTIADSLLLAFSWREKLASMGWLEMVLWVGLISLTVSLVVLMSTRLGQVRPVSKCVALSVLAHFLFLCYAYGTRLNLVGGSFSGDPFVTVTYVGSDEGDELEPLPSSDMRPVPAVDTAAVDLSEADTPAVAVEPRAAEATVKLPAIDTSPLPLAAAAPTAPPAATDPPAPELLAVPISPPADQPAVTPVDQEPSDPVADLVETESSRAEPSLPIAEHPPGDPAPSPPPEVAAESPPTATIAAAAPAPTTAMAMVAGGMAAAVVAPLAADAASTAAVPVRPVDGQVVPEAYRLRTAPDRKPFAFSFGATDETEAAVRAALAWLAAQQQQDGRWDASAHGAGHETKTLGHDRQGAGADADTGISGLALLAFLGAGETHATGDYHETVRRGLEFLLRSQDEQGHLAGNARLYERMYCHGIATLALSEAYAMTGDPRLLPALERAIGYSLAAHDRVSGGWRYQPGDRGDMSQFGWQVMALRSAQVGGLTIPSAHRTLMLKFLESAAQGSRRGLASYRPGERVTRTMTAEALTCRYFLGTAPPEPLVREAADFILQELPGQGEPNLYYWYYATLSLFQTQGQAWEIWNQSLQRQLLPRQRHDGAYAGSWDTRDVWGGYGGRIYTTAMAALCLEVYYRYLPIYDPQRAVGRRVGESALQR